MAKILMINLPFAGHTNPTLALAKTLVDRGHEVSYINAEAWREAIEITGANFIPYVDYPEYPTEEEKNNLCFMAAYHTALSVGSNYDIILYELLFYLGQVLADQLHKPCIKQFSMFAWNEHVIRALMHNAPMFYLFKFGFARNIVKKSQAEGIRLPYKNMFSEICNNVPGVNIVYTAKEFQICANEFDERFQFVGPAISVRASDISISFDRMKFPIVYISLGTLQNGNKSFFIKCIKAFAGKKVNIIMSIGEKMKKESLGDIPNNFHVFSFVPQLEVLKCADLFITHGGMNSVNESIYYGVPMIVAPNSFDQPTVANRVSELGLGVRIKSWLIKPDQLNVLTNKMLTSKKYKKNTMKMRRHMQQAGGISRAADIVEKYLCELS